MATVVTGLALNLTIQTAAYNAGLNAAAAATTRAAAQMTAAFNNVTAAANRLSSVSRSPGASGGGGLGTLFKGFIAYEMVKRAAQQVVAYADAWQVARNKLAAAEQIAGVQGRSMEALNKIATATRSPLEDIVDLYAKLIRTASGVVKSEADIAQITQTVAEGFKAGGASTLEQVNGIRQLAQALGSGILQGDELRSIRENAPLVAKAIADELGTTVAGLKQLGAEGKITSEVMARALIKSQDDIHAAFLKTTPTISESFTILNNAVTEYVGHVNEGTGASRTFAKYILLLANNFESIMDSIFGSGSVIGEYARFFWNMGDAIELLRRRFDELLKVDTSGWFSVVVGYARSLVNYFRDVGASLKAMNDEIKRRATYGGANPSVGGRTGMGHAFDYGILGGDEDEGYGKSGGGINPKAAKDAKKALEEHRSLINDVGSAYEKYKVQLDEISEKNYSVADTERAKSQALVEYYENLDKEREAIGLSLTPLQEYEAALRKIADAENNGRASAEMAFTARAVATANFAATSLAAFGALSGALTQLFKENKAIAIANAVISTAEGIANSLKLLPSPLAWVYAAAAAITGAAQISTIMSTQPGSSTKPTAMKGSKTSASSTVSSTSTTSTSSKRSPSQAVNITVQGDSDFSPERVRMLIGQINEAVGDGVQLRVMS